MKCDKKDECLEGQYISLGSETKAISILPRDKRREIIVKLPLRDEINIGYTTCPYLHIPIEVAGDAITYEDVARMLLESLDSALNGAVTVDLIN